MSARKNAGRDHQRLHPGMRFSDAAPYAIAPRLLKVFEHEEGARSGEDIEDVHDMRVASRRLRAAMSTFADCFPKHRYRSLRRDAAQLTQALGLVRDTDVLLEALQVLRAKAPDGEVAGIDDLIAVVTKDREAYRGAMIDAFDTLDQHDFRGRLQQILAQPKAKAEHGETVARVAQRVGIQRLAEFYGLVPFLHDPARSAELHEMRKAAKRLRYSLEIFHECFDTTIDARIDEVKTIQDHIGKIHDCDVLIDLVRQRMLVHEQEQRERLLAAAVEAQPQETRMEHIRGALGSGTTDPRPGLLGLLGRKTDERHERYSSFVAWWDDREARGLRTDLYACIASAVADTRAEQC